MKIVHVVPSFARGGGERLMIELANREAAAGHAVSVVSGFRLPEERSHQGLSDAVDLRFTSQRPSGGVPVYAALLPWIWRNRRWLGEQDVVHCHLSYGAMFGALLKPVMALTRRRGPAIVETYHAVSMPIPKWQRWLHARMAARRHGLSFMVADPYWERFRARRPHIVSRVIPVGVTEPDLAAVDAEARAAYRNSVGIPPGAERVVGTIGRISPDRQSYRYVAIFAAVARALGPGVHFLMGGDGPDMERVRGEVARHGLEGRVHLPGLVRDLAPPMAVMDLYITSNVGAVPGVAGLQAVAAGLPVVALQLAEGYVPGEQDWLWSSADETEVAARAVELLRSPEQAHAVATAQKAHVEANHSPRAMAAAYEALYREAAARRRDGPFGVAAA